MFDKFASKHSDIDFRTLIPLLLHTVAVQVVVSIGRVTTSYRIIELDLPVIWLGFVSATFAVLPVFLAVWVGRFMDRGNDARGAWIGAALMAVGSVGLLMAQSSTAALLGATAVLGVGHLFLIASQQMVCLRCASRRGRDSAFGNYMVANSIGQGLGPYIVGWTGGAATIPPTQLLFAISLAAAILALAFALAIRPSRKAMPASEGGGVVPVRELLRVPGLVPMLMASVIAVTASDLIVIYLPLLGAERSIDANIIGLLLTVRAAASMVSRLLYARMIGMFGRMPLMVTAIGASAAAFAVLAAPLPIPAMYAALAVLGFGIGVATTLTITNVIELTTPGTRGTANSLRIMGNRIGQVALPFGASLVAAAAGVAGVLLVIAVNLAVSGTLVHIRRPK
jgi:MFS family permease